MVNKKIEIEHTFWYDKSNINCEAKVADDEECEEPHEVDLSEFNTDDSSVGNVL